MSEIQYKWYIASNNRSYVNSFRETQRDFRQYVQPCILDLRRLNDVLTSTVICCYITGVGYIDISNWNCFTNQSLCVAYGHGRWWIFYGFEIDTS